MKTSGIGSAKRPRSKNLALISVLLGILSAFLPALLDRIGIITNQNAIGAAILPALVLALIGLFIGIKTLDITPKVLPRIGIVVSVGSIVWLSFLFLVGLAI